MILFLGLPEIVEAADYHLSNLIIDAEIEEDGDLHVRELLVQKGTFNGYERDILYANSRLMSGTSFANNAIYNASGIENMEIRGKYVNNVTFL